MSTEWEELNISRAWYFHHKKAQTHASLVDAYVAFRRCGRSERPWSTNHEKHSLYQLWLYLDRYPIVNYWGIKHFLYNPAHALSFSQKKDRHCALSGFSRFLLAEGLMDEVEAHKIQKLYPKRSPYEKPRRRLLDARQATIVCEADPMVRFLAETALRISEFASLRPKDLHYSDDPTQAFIEVTGKGGKYRVVPFSRKAQQCHWEFGKSRYHWGKHVQAVAKVTGIDFSAHSLRHWRATQWANNPRIPITVVKEWLGHDDLVTTQKYIHISHADALRAAFE